MHFTELVRLEPRLAGSLVWLVTTARLDPRGCKAKSGDAQTYSRIARHVTFYGSLRWYAFPVRKSLCAVPSDSETRQPARFAKNPLLQLELAKGLEPLTL